MHGSSGMITVPLPLLSSLLAPALANGVPPDRLKTAVTRLLHDGQKLAPWTLQEYVAKTGNSAKSAAWA